MMVKEMERKEDGKVEEKEEGEKNKDYEKGWKGKK